MQVARRKRSIVARGERAEAPRPLPAERVFSLVATLMGAGRPLTRDEIMERLAELYVPHGHAEPDPETLRKMFERDKALVKDMGIPLVAVPDGAGREDLEEGAVGYRIDEAGLHARPVDLDRTQRMLLAAIARAASESPGFPLGRDLAIAVQKIMLASGMTPGEEDVPFRILEQGGTGTGPSVDARIVEMALDAVERRRSVRIDYMDLGGRVTGRTVDPWGLVRAGGTWLLHGMCHLRKASRTFALHRAAGLEILRPRGRKPDFERPEGFSAESIASQRPHEYAVHDPVDVVLEADPDFAFRVEAMTGCAPSLTAGGACRFEVRATNVDALVEMALAYGPRVRVLAPADLVAGVLEGARAIGAATRGRRPARASSRAASVGRRKASRPAGREDASARLARYTFLVSYLSGREEADLSDLARVLGITEADVLRDIERLGLCGVYPSTEFRLFDVSVDAERGKVRLWRNPVPGLARPVALTSREAAALVLGAKLVRDGIAPPYDWAADRVVARVMEAAGEGIASAMAEIERCVSLESSREMSWDVFHEVAIAASKRLRIEIEYYTESRDSLGTRAVRPYVVACAAGRWYLVGWCEWRGDVRTFRLDRIRSARQIGGAFDPPKGFDPERHLGGGIYAAAPASSRGRRGRSGSEAGPATTAVVRFDPAFVSDHEGRDGFGFLDGHMDCEVTFDVEPSRHEGFLTWLLRMTPRFEILSPPDLRAALADRRDRLLAAYA